jgi:hypothetical protein
MAIGITAADVELVDNVRLGLLDCKSKKEIDAVFSKNNINNFALKTEFLYRAMQIQNVYGISDGTVPDPKDVYEYYVKFYLAGAWKEFV